MPRFKKGTIFECTERLKEGGPDYLLEVGDTFRQSEDDTNPVHKGRRYGDGWPGYMKIAEHQYTEPEKMDDEWADILKDINE